MHDRKIMITKEIGENLVIVYYISHFLFFNETVITKTQGLVVAIAKREYIN